MSRDLLIGALIGGMVGSAIGGWIHKSKAEYDADLVAYQNLAPTAVVEPTATVVPAHNCLTPDPTSTPEPAKDIAARKEWHALEKSEMKLHADDFISMPNPKSTYEGVPVEFFAMGPSRWQRMDGGDGLEPDDPIRKTKTPYEKFYGVSDNWDSKDRDETIINGFKRRTVFDWIEDEQFASLHKPFYGIKVIYYTYGDIPSFGRPAPRWIYIVWSAKRKAPIPFAYPSEAIKLVKRQMEKKR